MRQLKPLVVIPWRPSRGRWRNYAMVREFYAEHYPDWPVRDMPGPATGPFNLAAARNMGVAYGGTMPDRVIVLNDADTVPEVAALDAAVLATMDDPERVTIGYSRYRALTPSGTQQAHQGVPLAMCEAAVVSIAISGLYVTTPRGWWRTYGQDERFLGWAPEDYAWLVAYRALVGEEPRRVEGAVHALAHPPAPRTGDAYEAMVARYQGYLAAAEAGDVERIRHLAQGGS